MGRHLQERDLRSLERRSMYSIFHPLDVDEPLPRELIQEGWRQRMCEIRVLEVTGALYLPVLMVVMIVLGSMHVNPILGFVAMATLFGAFLIYVLSARDR
ncbi:MAG: hypothetical protein E6I21_02925 [Chloroflexi bacterium]|nr:MAG: hypothetical protein E6I21_02925 [Chloroflexota bacterium]